MKAVFMIFVAVSTLAFGGCATGVSDKEYATAKERRAQRASLCAQTSVFKCEAVAAESAIK